MKTFPRLRLQVLGRFLATVDGPERKLISISAPRHRALLAYLALQPGLAETRERLATLLWGQSTDRQARQSLRQSLLSLRKDLVGTGLDVIQSDREIVRLDASQLTVDAVDFQVLARSDARADIERAATLYGGDLLDGLDLDVQTFDVWLRSERARIKATAVSTLDALARRLSAADEGAGAVRAAERLVGLEPDEEAHQRLLIEVLFRNRGPVAALAQAEATRKLTREEMGCDLEPETLELIVRLKAMPKQPHSLEPPPTNSMSSLEKERTERAPAPVDAEVTAAVVAKRIPIRGPNNWSPVTSRWGVAAAGASLALVAALALLQPLAVDSSTRSAGSALPPSPAADVRANVNRALEDNAVTAIVVLPFVAEAGEPPQTARMAQLISDDLIGNLSRVPSFRVIAKSASSQYAERPVDVAALGQTLGVSHAVEGSVRLTGSKVRVSVALIDVATRLQVWADRYERDGAEGPSVHDEMVRGLARQLHVTIMQVRSRPAEAGGVPPTINETLSRAWAELTLFAFFRGGLEAGQLFEEVLRVQPENRSALTGLGAFKTVSAVTLQTSLDPALLLEQSGALLTKAMALNPQASLPHYFLGLRAAALGRAEEAMAFYARTLEINPSYAPAYAAKGLVLLSTGRLDEALEQVSRAIRMSPQDHYLGMWSLYLGRIHLELGNDEETERWLT